uniref:Uncharacterized protein n=1 Tax=Chromera velia CCMP2878 TaxID=1169474 RepID=A0A0G4G026_9ALVE|eukprot:Cvel_19546.t1-p1 / transcript=Cvel_19546.t1 / gene=Cvel_19546 / organism=Chromera_velia_CCMP2878 / gene_product=hypothetical protein / transcript_product=hypothetical protein / location=Cvel_scaffold1694:755-3030(-) / protein_length=266 / sequence_SO=supercontig / SO=protein_coding / is_pseudo=false
MRVRLGLRIPELVRQPVCGCGQRGDLEGVHGGKCPTGGGPWRRHQKVGAAFFELLTGVRYYTVGGETMIGLLGLDLTGPLAEERDKRLDLFVALPNGDSVLGDVALIHPIQDATRLHRNAKKAGAAAKEKGGKKHTHYDDACRAVGIRFVPLVFETYGRPGGETVRYNDTSCSTGEMCYDCFVISSDGTSWKYVVTDGFLLTHWFSGLNCTGVPQINTLGEYTPGSCRTTDTGSMKVNAAPSLVGVTPITLLCLLLGALWSSSGAR